MSSAGGLVSTAAEVPFAGFEGGIDDLEGGGGRWEPRGPEGGSFGGGLLDFVRLEDRGGVRVRALALPKSFRGEPERLRGRSGRRDGGSSIDAVSNHCF